MEPEAMPRTLLIVHPGSLGDVLLSLPALRSVRAAYPAHACALLAGGSVAGLLARCGEVNVVFPLEQGGLTGIFAGPESVDPSLRDWLERADLVVGWMGDPDGSLTRTFQAIGAVNVVVGTPHASELTSRHQSERYLDIIRAFVPPVATAEPLRLTQSLRDEAQPRLAAVGVVDSRVMVVLHPGSGSPHKCTRPMLFAQVVDQLQVAGLTPVLVGGPADDEPIALVTAVCAKQPAVVTGLDLCSMAVLLSRAAMFMGHDSGLTHLAALLAVPTLALFGPTDPGRWAPRGPRVDVLQGEPCLCADWDRVQRCADRPCLRIPAERVMEHFQRRLRISMSAAPAASAG